MEHIQTFENGSILAWEAEHGITRTVRGGCEYVTVTNYERFEAACENDRVRNTRHAMMAAQEEAYLGGVQR